MLWDTIYTWLPLFYCTGRCPSSCPCTGAAWGTPRSPPPPPGGTTDRQGEQLTRHDTNEKMDQQSTLFFLLSWPTFPPSGKWVSLCIIVNWYSYWCYFCLQFKKTSNLNHLVELCILYAQVQCRELKKVNKRSTLKEDESGLLVYLLICLRLRAMAAASYS